MSGAMIKKIKGGVVISTPPVGSLCSKDDGRPAVAEINGENLCTEHADSTCPEWGNFIESGHHRASRADGVTNYSLD